VIYKKSHLYLTYPETTDGRYFVAKNRLWRKTNPNLDEAKRQELVNQLMKARRDIAEANRTDNSDLRKDARQRMQKAKVGLGERGRVWWDDESEDQSGKHPKNSIYAEWWQGLDRQMRKKATE
jgi:hypothetical protein